MQTGEINSSYWGHGWDYSNPESPSALGCAGAVLKSRFYQTDSEQLCIAHFHDQEHTNHNPAHHSTANQSPSELSSPSSSGIYNATTVEDDASLHSPTSTAGSDSFQQHLAAVFHTTTKPKRLINHPIYLLQKVHSKKDALSDDNNEDVDDQIENIDIPRKTSSQHLPSQAKTFDTYSCDDTIHGEEELIKAENLRTHHEEILINEHRVINASPFREQERSELPELHSQRWCTWKTRLRALFCGLSTE